MIALEELKVPPGKNKEEAGDLQGHGGAGSGGAGGENRVCGDACILVEKLEVGMCLLLCSIPSQSGRIHPVSSYWCHPCLKNGRAKLTWSLLHRQTSLYKFFFTESRGWARAEESRLWTVESCTL